MLQSTREVMGFCAESGVMIGSTISHFEVIERIGAGGMGEVYRARDNRLGRDVALKVLPKEVAVDPERLLRFEREARILARLSHPNILSIYEFGAAELDPPPAPSDPLVSSSAVIDNSGAIYYVVTELLRGSTLRDRLKHERLTWRRSVEIAANVAEGLAAAHSAGVIHRDLKPENIFLTTDGRVKVLDFGLARRTVPLEDDFDVEDARTDPGRMLGTIGYMSPEQVRGHAADAHSDVFVLGCVLYEMLSGNRAFFRDSPAETISAILKDPIPDLPEQPNAPPELGRILARCMEKQPAQRFQSAADLAFALKGFGATTTLTSQSRMAVFQPTLVSRLAAWGLRAALVLLLIAAGALLYRVLSPAPARPVVRLVVPIGNVTSPMGSNRTFALSPDSRQLAVVVLDAGVPRIAIRPIDALTMKVLPGTDNAADPFWSPDCRRLAFFADGLLKRISIGGGAVETLCPAPGGVGGSWHADSIVFSDGGTLMQVGASGGAPSPLGGWRDYMDFPVFLPGGKFLLADKLSKSNWNVVVIDPGGKTTRDLMEARGAIATGNLLVYLKHGALFVQRFDPRKAIVEGAPVPLKLDDGLDGAVVAFSLAADGALAYRRAGHTEIRWFDRQGNAGDALPLPGACSNPEMSPDGTKVALDCMTPGQAATTDIWTIGLTDGRAVRITADDAVDSDAAWSPDGRDLVFSSNRNGDPDLFRVRAGGTPELLLKMPGEQYPMGWWPGPLLTFASGWGEQSPSGSKEAWGDMWVLDGPTPRPVIHTRFSETEGQLSPDGRLIVYTSDESSRYEVYVRALGESGGKWRISTNGGSKPRWRPDGKEIFYLAPDRTLMSVAVESPNPFQPARPVPLFHTRVAGSLGVGLRYSYAVSADGQRFLMYAGDPTASLVLVVNAAAEFEQTLAAGQ